MSAATIPERVSTYQTHDQLKVERAFDGARAAMEGLKCHDWSKPDEPASEGLYRLGLHVGTELRDDGARITLPEDGRGANCPQYSYVGIALWKGPYPVAPDIPYTVALITHPFLMALENWPHKRLPIFEDGYMGHSDMVTPYAAVHRLILLGLLRLFEPLVEELRKGEDWNWGPFGDEDEETFHPSEMLASVRKMIATVERTVVAFEVMHS
jgi:hypothetical protein